MGPIFYCYHDIIDRVFIFNGGQYFIETDHFCYIILRREGVRVLFRWVSYRITTPGLYSLGGGRVVRWCWINFQCRGVLQF